MLNGTNVAKDTKIVSETVSVPKYILNIIKQTYEKEINGPTITPKYESVHIDFRESHFLIKGSKECVDRAFVNLKSYVDGFRYFTNPPKLYVPKLHKISYSSIPRLPTDIVRLMFDNFLPKEDRFFARLVCRDWYLAIHKPKLHFSSTIDHYTTYGSLCSLKLLYKMFGDAIFIQNFFAMASKPTVQWFFTLKTQHSSQTILNATIGGASGGHIELVKWGRAHGIDWKANYGQLGSDIVNAAAKNGHLDLLKWAKSNGCSKTTCLFYGAMNGHLHIVEWALDNGYKWDSNVCAIVAANGHEHIQIPSELLLWDSKVCNFAAKNGHLSILQWAVANGQILDVDICDTAASNGHIHILEWALNYGFTLHNTSCLSAASDGHLHTLKWMFDHGFRLSNDLVHIAAKYGHLDMLRWLVSIGHDLDAETSAIAAKNGHIHILKWVIANGSRWSYKVCEDAATLDIVDWSLSNGCPWDDTICEDAASAGRLDILKLAKKHRVFTVPRKVCCAAAINGHLHILEWLVASRYTLDYSTGTLAAQYGHLHILEWLLDNGYNVNPHILSIAGNKGWIDIVKWAIAMEFPWDRDTYVAMSRYLNTLDWAIEQGYNRHWNLMTFAARNMHESKILYWLLKYVTSEEISMNIAKYGHYSAIWWLYRHGYKIDKRFCQVAAENGHVALLQRARTYGLEWGRACWIAAENKRFGVITWARQIGCKCGFDHNDRLSTD